MPSETRSPNISLRSFHRTNEPQKHMYLHKLRGRAFVLFFTLGTLQAAEPQKAVELTERVVTATKTETERWRTASTVTVIDRQEIDDKQYRRLPEALSQVPGLAIVDNGSPGTLAGVFLRGSTTQQTAFLINGRPIPMNLAGSFNPETMGLDNVERIEVLRGPSASLYGGKTIGGVINIITRSGKGLAKPEHSIFFETGSYGTFREGLASRGAIGILDWSIDAMRTDIQGQRINSQLQQTNTSGTLGLQLADSLRLDLDWRYYQAEVGNPGSVFANDPDDNTLSEFWSVSPRLTWETTKRWTQTLTYQMGNFRQVATGNTSPFGPFDNRITSRNHFFEYQSVVRMTDKWTLTAGAWLQDQSFNRYNDAAPGFFNPGGQSYDIDQHETNWAVFLQSQAEILPGWNVVTGLRHDSYSDFADATTWRAGTSWRMPWTQTILHANYGTAFAPPTPQDREGAIWAPFGGQLINLKPERSRGFEVGIEQPIEAANLNLALTWFHNDLHDTFEFVGAPAFLQPVGKARREGFEASAQWQPCKEFGFNASYTYLESDNLTTGRRLVRQPRHMITTSMTLRPQERLTFTLSGSYVIDREDFDAATFARFDAEDYLLARLSANWQVSQQLDVFARVENLFGDDYQAVAGFPTFDTGAYAGFRLRF